MAKFIQHSSVKYHFQSIVLNFFATSHSKGAVDAVGGLLKRFVWNSIKSRKVFVLKRYRLPLSIKWVQNLFFF